MHRTLIMEATRPAGSNFLQQQAKFDAFVEQFNNERPHEALDRKCPAEIYWPSTRHYRGLGELSCPFHDRTAFVTYCGRICIFRKKINLSIGARLSPGKPSASRRSMRVFGLSVLWTRISVISILRRRLCNP